ncbi:putative Ash1 [Cryphonectria parasitica EP155]|uniref:Ash1 n=1 Tax=Cryphonectria parasitica (strain ATCC 38755 / EP155) TaxID=660469 RepID=A0A9P5CR03_CRYP1|nr:putative Ash1 [Cryphonectria parasitica EP155]KAF3766746.1 putative Ash1 [Cryphonectria parasitica EP155]
MEAVTKRHFFHHGPDQEVAIEERQNCHWCQLRSFRTHKTLPVTIVNDTGDGQVLPSNFRFIERSVLGAGVPPTADEFRYGCDCPDEDSCMYAGCACLDEMAGSDDDQEDSMTGELDKEDEEPEWARQRGSRQSSRDDAAPSPAPAADTGKQLRKKRFAYHSQGAKAGLLRGSELENSRAPIYECHEGCRCSKAGCPNRIVERGRQVPLQIFRTDNRGWGVKTMRALKRGQFVDCYLGEIITPSEAERRRHNASKAQRKDVYLFALDKFTDPESNDLRLRGAPLECDGEFMSGPTRFINHSCEPNLRIFARVGDHADKHIHDLALFAIEDVQKDEELTFDYVDGQGEIASNARDAALQGEMTRCLCGSEKCRGYLW